MEQRDRRGHIVGDVLSDEVRVVPVEKQTSLSKSLEEVPEAVGAGDPTVEELAVEHECPDGREHEPGADRSEDPRRTCSPHLRSAPASSHRRKPPTRALSIRTWQA